MYLGQCQRKFVVDPHQPVPNCDIRFGSGTVDVAAGPTGSPAWAGPKSQTLFFVMVSRLADRKRLASCCGGAGETPKGKGKNDTFGLHSLQYIDIYLLLSSSLFVCRGRRCALQE